MTGPYREIQVRLHRDAFNTPWGFRLQGGKDFKTALTVQRVFVGSPADTELQRGDVLVAVENYDATTMVHKQAQDIIKAAGGTLSLRIKRGMDNRARSSSPSSPQQSFSQQHSYRSRVLDTTFSPLQPAPSSPGMCNQNEFPNYRPQQPHPQAASNQVPSVTLPSVDYSQSPNYRPHQPNHHQQHQLHHHQPSAPVPVNAHHSQPGVDYSQGSGYSPRRGQAPPTSMLSRVQRSLNESLWTPEYGDPDYPNRSVGDLKQVFGPGGGQDADEAYRRRSVRDLQHFYQKNKAAGRNEPGWAPKSFYNTKPSMQSRSHGPSRHVGGAPQPSQPPPGWSHVPAPERGGYDISGPYHGHGSAPQQSYPDFQSRPQSQPHGSAPQQSYPDFQSRPQSQPHGSAPQQSYLDIQSRPPPPPVNRSLENEDAYGDSGKPPWAGSLQSSGGPKPWEVQAAAQALQEGWSPAQNGAHHQRQRSEPSAHYGGGEIPHQPKVQNMHYSPGGRHEYQQHNPNSHGPSDSARVTHQQYNTPIGLYSRENVQAMLDGQTKGKPGEGTMRVEGLGTGKTLDLEKSSVYRLIHEQEDRRGPVNRSARNQEHAPGSEMEYHGYMNHQRQSRSMHLLEHQMEQDYGTGTSDF